VVLRAYQPGDMVWVQDYHLMLLPSMLKTAVPKMKVCTHIRKEPKQWCIMTYQHSSCCCTVAAADMSAQGLSAGQAYHLPSLQSHHF